MNVVTVEKQDWEPTSKNQRMEELPAETHVIHTPTKLVDNEGNAIAVITRTPEDHHAELTWMEGEGHGFFEKNDRAIKMATRFFKEQYSNFIQK